MSNANLPWRPDGLPSVPICRAFDSVMETAVQDAYESGYRACRRHLISAVLSAPGIDKCMSGVGAEQLAKMTLDAALATNTILDKTLFPRRPHEHLGRSFEFENALRDALAVLPQTLGK